MEKFDFAVFVSPMFDKHSFTDKNIKTQITNIEQAVNNIDTQSGTISDEILNKLSHSKPVVPTMVQKPQTAQ